MTEKRQANKKIKKDLHKFFLYAIMSSRIK